VGERPLKKTLMPSSLYELMIVDEIVRYGLESFIVRSGVVADVPDGVDGVRIGWLPCIRVFTTSRGKVATQPAVRS